MGFREVELGSRAEQSDLGLPRTREMQKKNYEEEGTDFGLLGERD